MRGWLISGLFWAAPALAQPFPVTIETAFGPTTIHERPERVVSIGYITQDFLLALGVTPIAVREWFGNKPYGAWEWAQVALGDAQPEILYGEINVERIASLHADLIVGYWSGMTAHDFAILNQIAPTLAPAKGEPEYGTPWQNMLLRIGRAVGEERRAEAITGRLEGRLRSIRAEHPVWAGQTLAMAWPGNVGAYTSEDIRGQLAQSFGMQVPAAVDALEGPNDYLVYLPGEDMSAIDADALVWLDSGGRRDLIDRAPLRKTMTAHREGREIYSDPLLSAALSFSSPLSLDYALDELVPLLEAALDGDPSTPVASSVSAGIAP